MLNVEFHKSRKRRGKRGPYFKPPELHPEFQPFSKDYMYRKYRPIFDRGGDFVTRTQDNTRVERILEKEKDESPFKSLLEKYMNMPRK